MKAALTRSTGPLVLWDPNDEHRELDVDFAGPASSFFERARSGAVARRARVWGSESDFRALSRYVYRVGRMTFAVDEAHLYVPRTGDPRHPFRELVLTVRHRRVALHACAWRPVDLPRYLTAAGGTAYVFKTTERLDLDWWRKTAGDEFAAQLPSLPVGKPALHKR